MVKLLTYVRSGVCPALCSFVDDSNSFGRSLAKRLGRAIRSNLFEKAKRISAAIPNAKSRKIDRHGPAKWHYYCSAMGPNHPSMKQFLCSTFLLFLFSAHSNAQPQKKDILLGAGVSVYSDHSASDKRVNAQFSPSIGRMVTDLWLVGTTVGFQYYKYLRPDTSNYLLVRTNTPIVGFFARRYFPLAPKLYLNLTGSNDLSLEFYSSKSAPGDSPYQSSEFTADLAFVPGITYFLAPNWSVFAQFGSLRYSFNLIDPSESHFQLSLTANSFGLGVQYFLRKRAK